MKRERNATTDERTCVLLSLFCSLHPSCEVITDKLQECRQAAQNGLDSPKDRDTCSPAAY